MVRLVRMVPMLVVLALLAGVVYLVVAARQSPNRAKEVLIKVFLVVTVAISAFFLLVSLYALAEQNTAVFDLALAFCMAGLVGLAVTLLCRWNFLRHHPKYRIKAQPSKRLSGWQEAVKRLVDVVRRMYRL